MVCLMA